MWNRMMWRMLAASAATAVVGQVSACAAPDTRSGGIVKEVVVADGLPKVMGPYSQAVRAGDLLFIAGQPGLHPETGEMVGNTFDAQARQAFNNLAAVLQASGSGLPHVVKTTVFMSDAANFAAMNQLYAEFFPEAPPVRATPIVQLPRGLLVSIEAVAVVPGGR